MSNLLQLPLTKKLLRDLNAKKMLVLALSLVLSVAVCCLSGMGSVYQDLNQGKNAYYKKTHLADFTIDVKKAPINTLTAIAHLPNIKQLQSRISYNMMVTLPPKSPLQKPATYPGIGISINKQTRQSLNQIILDKGTWFSANNAAEGIVVQQFAAAHHLEPGDWLKVRLGGEQYKILIVGIAYSPEYVYILPPGSSLAPDPAGYGVIFMPRGFLSERTNLRSGYNQLIGTLNDNKPASITRSMNLIARQLQQYSVLAKTPQSKQPSVQTLQGELTDLVTITSFFPFIFLVVSALVVNVLLTRIVAQQRVIIGTLKSLGVGNITLFSHYVSFGLVIGVLGGIIGCGFGIILQYAAFNMYKTIFIMPGLVFHLYYSVLSIGIIVSLLATLMGSISGSVKAIKLEPAEAMRPESPKDGGRIMLDHIKLIWLHLSFRGKLIARSIFRNKFRSIVTLLSTLVATALLLSTISLTDSMQKLIKYHFTVLSHQQFTLSLREPLGTSIISTMATIPGITQMESHLLVVAKLWNGPYSKTTQVRGMPPNNQLYTPYDDQGQLIHMHHGGIILSHALAKILHVKAGDNIKLQLKIGQRTIKTVKVIKLMTSDLGFAAYMNQDILSKYAGNSWLANQVLFNIQQPLISYFKARINTFPSVINLQDKYSLEKILTKLISGSLTSMIVIISIFAGAIAISCIVNNSMVSLSERERDVATFAVLGMTQKEIFMLFFYEGLIINILALILGLWLGVYIAKGFVASLGTEMYHFPFVLRHIRIVEAGSLILFFIMISYFLVYRAIANTNWLAVLNIRE